MRKPSMFSETHAQTFHVIRDPAKSTALSTASIEREIQSGKTCHPLFLDAFYCPLTLTLLKDPMIDPDGHTFERKAIENWIKSNGTSPLTRSAYRVEDLYPNHAIAALLDLERKNRDKSSSHPDSLVRGWEGESSLRVGYSESDSKSCDNQRLPSGQDDEPSEAEAVRCSKLLDILAAVTAIASAIVIFALLYLVVIFVQRS